MSDLPDLPYTRQFCTTNRPGGVCYCDVARQVGIRCQEDLLADDRLLWGAGCEDSSDVLKSPLIIPLNFIVNDLRVRCLRINRDSALFDGAVFLWFYGRGDLCGSLTTVTSETETLRAGRGCVDLGHGTKFGRFLLW